MVVHFLPLMKARVLSTSSMSSCPCQSWLPRNELWAAYEPPCLQFVPSTCAMLGILPAPKALAFPGSTTSTNAKIMSILPTGSLKKPMAAAVAMT